MTKFDVYRIGEALFLVVQADHLLALNTVVLVPVLPRGSVPPLSRLTVDVVIGTSPCIVLGHAPLTVEARRLRRLKPVARLSDDEGQQVMDALNTILWGL
jgi:hypothetical protein